MGSARKIFVGGLGTAAALLLLIVLITYTIDHYTSSQATGDNGKTSSQVAFGDTQTLQGQVNLPATTVMLYTSNNSGDAYMTAGVTLDTFDGHFGWTTHTNPPTQSHYIGTADVIVPESAVVTQVQQTIQLVNAPAGPYVFALGEPGGFSFPITAHSDGIALNSTNTTGSYTDWQVTPGTLNNGTRYTATSFVSTATADQLRKVSSPPPVGSSNALYPADLLARYRQLPTDLQDSHDASVLQGQRVIAQAKAINMYDEAVALVGYFHHTFSYTSSPGPVPRDKDVVDYLLTKQAMYCTWFATGFTMMARELGLPARIVEGFTPGLNDPDHPGYKIIKGTDAHAWSQIYFPGYGWINFEPSASFTGPTPP
jgi:hypothetical protein